MDIQDIVRRHDAFHIELKLDYDLSLDGRKDRYGVEYFFFLPDNLDVNDATYSKSEFYRDMLLYIRFKAPRLPLETLSDLSTPHSPLQKMHEKWGTYQKSPTPYNATVLAYEIKLFACVLKESLWERVRVVRQALEKVSPAEAAAAAVGTVESWSKISRLFRAFRDALSDPGLPPLLSSTFSITDEYVSLLVEGRAHQMLQAFQKHPSARLDAARQGLLSLVQDEVAYRRSRGWPSVVEDGRDNETFVYRLGVLKKFVSSVLHLSVRTEREGRGLEELALALGAGFAMLLATGIAFHYQRVYGTLSLSFFTAVVVSYMFKDRLKAMVQAWVQRQRADRLMDFSNDILDPFTGRRMGVCRELVHFVKEEGLDPVVLRLRNRDHITEIENSWRREKVLRYTKEIRLKPTEAQNGSARKTALTDIARFDLRHFLSKVDEPFTDVFTLVGDGSEVLSASRVYHVNLVIKFTSRAEVRYHRVRLVVDQRGLKRVECVRSETVSL